MNIRSREGVRRQRPPKALVLFMCICIFSSMQLGKGNRCGHDEMRKCSDGDCRCLKCLLCPPGQGLVPQCSSITLDGNMTMKCLPCQDGTYSNQSDFGSCEACNLCIGEETLQKCNATHNALCKEGCMDGYKLDKISHMCEKIPTIPRKKITTNNPPTSTRPYVAETPSLMSTTLSSNKDSGPDKIQAITGTPTKPQKTVTARPTAAVLPTAIILTGKNNSVIKTIQRITRTPDFVYVLFSVLLFLFFCFVGFVGFKERQRIKSFIIRCKKHLLNEGQDKSNLEAIPMNPFPQEQEQEETIVDLTNQSPPGQQEECSGHGTPTPGQVDLGGESLDEVIISSPPGQQGGCLDHGPSSSRDPHGPGVDPISSTSALQHGEGLEEATAMPDASDVNDMLLRDLPSELEKKIAVKTSIKGLKGWMEIAKVLEVADDDELEHIETGCSYGESMLPDNPNHSGSLLMELSPELKVGISVHLYKEHQPGWKEIGRVYNIPPQKLEEFQARSKASSGDKLPGEFLFEYLEGSKPKLTVLKFLHALKAIERNDIICFISEEYFKSHLGHSSDST